MPDVIELPPPNAANTETVKADTAPAATEKAPAPKPAKDSSSLSARWLSRRAAPEEKPAAAATPEPATEVKKEDAKPEPKPTAKPKATKPAPIQPQQPDYKEMGAEIAAGIREGIKPLVATPKEGKPDRAESLSYSERRTLEVIRQLEKDHPRYKGRAEKYLDSIQKEEDYANEWMAKNPDRDYDPKEDEHKAFFKVHGTDDIDDDDFEAAKESVLRSEITREVRKELEPELAKRLAPIEESKRLEAEMPRIIKSRVTAAQKFLSQLGDNFAKVIGKDGRIDLAEGDRLVAENPANNIPLNLSLKVQSFAEQLHRLARAEPLPPLEKPANPNIPYVSPKEVEDIALKYEAELAAAPANLSLSEGGNVDDQGRRFATHDEWEKMTSDQKRRHWRLDGEKITLMYAVDQAEAAKAEMPRWEQEMEAYVKAKGYVKNGEVKKPDEPKPEPKPEPTPVITPSPPGAIAPNHAQQMTKGNTTKESGNSGWLSSWTGRK